MHSLVSYDHPLGWWLMIITFVPLKARILQLTMLDWRIAGTRIPANLFQHLEICGWSWLEMPLGKLYTFQSFLGSLVLVGWMCEKEGAYPPDHFFFWPQCVWFSISWPFGIKHGTGSNQNRILIHPFNPIDCHELTSIWYMIYVYIYLSFIINCY